MESSFLSFFTVNTNSFGIYNNNKQTNKLKLYTGLYFLKIKCLTFDVFEGAADTTSEYDHLLVRSNLSGL